jgi:VanZ family protein
LGLFYFYFTGYPGTDIPTVDFFKIIYFDKWVHIGLFGILSILWGYPFIKSKIPVKAITVVALAVIGYGIIMEFVQKYYTSGRSFDITDIFADTAGTLLGVIVLIKIWKQSESRIKK